MYRVASCERRLGRFNEAYAHFRRASDLDRVPHGAPTSFNDDVRIVAQEEGALFVDVEKLLERESAYGLVGDDLFVDFCHPNLRAHQRIAQELVQQLQVAGVPVPAERWTPGRYVDPDSGSLYRGRSNAAYERAPGKGRHVHARTARRLRSGGGEARAGH